MEHGMDHWLTIWGPHAVGALFAWAIGACIGSFAQVIGERMPEGISIIRPPSRCVHCGRLLAWSENLPVFGWFICGGRCWSCGGRIPFRYPIIEFFVGILFALVYLQMFAADYHGFWGPVGGAFYQRQGFLLSLPALCAISVLLTALIAATLTDLRSYSIPLAITLVPTVVALVAWPLQAAIVSQGAAAKWPLQLPGGSATLAALGGGLGLLVSIALTSSGFWRRSFSDYGDFMQGGAVFADYPHARREMWIELRFLLPVVAGSLGGWMLGRGVVWSPILELQAAAAALLGYFAGAGLVWAVRIAGTLWRGQEAMGLGDVHLMGAVGAVMGWIDPVTAFVVAPFPALAWVAISRILSRGTSGGRTREIPYGPWLALAQILLMVARPFFVQIGRSLFPAFFA
jgi:leader peptidase (prepilin peptidase)/N-methyltransferase